MIFLRLRKAFRKKHLISWTLALYASNGSRKMGAQLMPCLPGDEPAILDQIATESGDDDNPAEITLDANSVILVGERAAGLSGIAARLPATCRAYWRATGLGTTPGRRSRRRGGRLPAQSAACGRPLSDAAARVDTQTTWGVESVPSVEGRDADEILIAAADGELEALVVAGVDPNDFVDPQAALEGLEKVNFVISVETRASSVTERANVVFPVSLMQERPAPS